MLPILLKNAKFGLPNFDLVIVKLKALPSSIFYFERINVGKHYNWVTLGKL
jgi:hypothetical protein